MDEMDEAAPEPAAPILASSLLDLEIKQRRRFAAQGERISTGCREVDEVVLGGDGLERGIVVGVSAEGGQGRLVSKGRSGFSHDVSEESEGHSWSSCVGFL
jgi:hypothetical protein